MLDEPFHINTVRSSITRNLITRFDDIRSDIVQSFDDYVPQTKGIFEASPTSEVCSTRRQIGSRSQHLNHLCTLYAALLTDTLSAFLSVSSFSVLVITSRLIESLRPRTRLYLPQRKFCNLPCRQRSYYQLFPKIPSAVSLCCLLAMLIFMESLCQIRCPVPDDLAEKRCNGSSLPWAYP
jgi:hypothetical protein